MRALLLTAVAVTATAALHAQGRGDFEFHRDLAPGKRFHLQNIIGDVQVTGTTGRTVQVTATKRAGRHGDPADVTIEVVEVSDGVALCVRYPQSRWRNHSDDSDDRSRNPCSQNGNWGGNGDRNDTEVMFTVQVPSGLRLHLGTVSGDLTAEKLDGELDLQSVSGDVRLIGGQGASIQLETVSGSVELTDVRSKDVAGQTVSGDVTFRGPVLDAGSYDFATTSGDIRIGLPARPNATLSAATFSGRFSSDLPTSQNENRRRRHRYEATWGSGTAKLEAESLSGDISIRIAGQ